ncbi:MAG: hypothetical protein M5R38_15470 [Candidatus Methylomirabilis sp.]|nr:hypothetical protein [Candidatus Methylomirabilis sp.]
MAEVLQIEGVKVDIRSVLGKVAEIMIREAPHLFGDFTALPLPRRHRPVATRA